MIDLLSYLKTYVLSKKDTEKMLSIINDKWKNITVPKIKNIKVFEIESNRSILVVDSILAVSLVDQEIIIPFLNKINLLDKFPAVTVDSGSIKFICNGAKVLRPGIVHFELFEKNDIVVIKEEKYKKYLSVGLALSNSTDAEKLEKGAIIDNLHYIGDKFWDAFKEISFRIN